MPYYIAVIELNLRKKKSKKDEKKKKRFALRFAALTMLFLLVSTLTIAVGVPTKHAYDLSCDDDNDITEYLADKYATKSLKRLWSAVARLPKDAYIDSENSNDQKHELHDMTFTVIGLVEAGEYEQALIMLNEIKNAIQEWIREPWQTYLIEKVEFIIWIIEWFHCIDRKPPKIEDVLRFPDSPNYDEQVTVVAYVVDKQSGVQLVNLSYSVNTADWVNMTMESTDGLYTAEISSQPYDTTVNYKVYAWDNAGNLAVSEPYSYVVADSYPPVISYVDRVPASPVSHETVTVFANVTEPLGASGVKNVMLQYKTDGEWQPVEMTLEQLYTGVIPGFPFGTVVQYSVEAFDHADNWAASGIFSYTVGVPSPNLPPVAIFTESEETVSIEVVIHFNASQSYDPDGTIVSYFWDFGDGTNATGATADHAYSSSGTYVVTLKITDDDGAVDSAFSIITVLALNQPPVAAFTESATTVFTNDIIQFNASASYDPDGTITSYSWDFGDGNVATGAVVEHAYEDDGTYNVTLTVTDDEGATDTITSTKQVKNRPPVASFTESAETVYTNEVVAFDATSSHDPDGEINSYLWDFGDGTQATAATVNHAYADDGIYIVILTVTDDDGSTAWITSVKTVLNRAPEASFAASATTVLAGETIDFNASESRDLDGSIIGYIWDFGDETSAAGVNVSHVYQEIGNYTVTLTVIDDDGATSSVDITIAVVTPIGLPLSWLAVIILVIVALTITAGYLLYSRRRKKTAA